MTYTPTTREVKEWYADSIDRLGGEEEFDRWYAEEIRKAKQEAWLEGYALACLDHGGYENCGTENPHNASNANPYKEQK